MSTLELIKQNSFYYLKQTPASPPNGKSILFLHGLGENRCGINYLFRDLSSALASKGYTVYRFDLGGCGDSVLPLSLSIWQEQLDTFLDSVSIVIARGLSSILLPLEGKKSIQLRPFSKEHFTRQYPLISANLQNGSWIPDANHSMNEREENFWFQLGVETDCLGGLFLPIKLIEEIKSFSIKPGHLIIDPPDSHPLFLFQKDKQLLLKQLGGIL